MKSADVRGRLLIVVILVPSVGVDVEVDRKFSISIVKRNGQHGLHLVLMSVLITTMLILIALVVTLALMMSNRTKLQNSSNLAALGAIESLMSNTSLAYQERAERALVRANEILRLNKLVGAQELGLLRHKTSDSDLENTLELGMYYPFIPPNGSPCANYPCYVALPGPPSSLAPDTTANAVRVRANSGEMRLPLGELIGGSVLKVSTPSTATMIERCTAFILDISPSVSLTSHQYSNDVLVPIDDPGSLAFQEHIIRNIEDEEDLLGGLCQPQDRPGSLNYKYFCAMPQSRANNFDPTVSHYRSDYKTVDSKAMRVRVDLFTTPEPFRTFLLAYNAGLRQLVDMRTFTDKFVLIAFNRDIVDRLPSSGLTADLPYLQQITNLDNIGKVDSNGQFIPGKEPIHPNLIDRGWLSPIGNTGFTNIIKAMHEAVGALSNPDFCPSSARKSIVIASDGILNCQFNRSNGQSNCDLKYDLGVSNNTYVGAEARLLGRTGTPGDPNNPILYDLIQSKIRVTSLITGRHVEPNFKNIIVDNRYLDFESAIGRGYYGIPTTKNDPMVFFNVAPFIGLPTGPGGGYLLGNPPHEICTAPHELGDQNRCAWAYAGAIPGVIFRRAVGVMGELAFRTGGTFCPLMPILNNSSCYDAEGKLKDCCRNGSGGTCGAPPGSFQTYALTDRGAAVDAAECVLKTIAENPYTLLPPL